MENDLEPIVLPGTGERYLPGMALSIHLEHMHRYHLACKLAAGKTVLDIASGEGYGSNLMATVAEHVTGVDIAPDAVEFAKRKYKRANLEYKQGDAAKMPMADGSVDLVVSFETIEHHDKHIEMMAEIRRVLKPQGVLLISSPDKLYYSDLAKYNNHYHVKELYEKEFRDLVSKYFAKSHCFFQRLMYGSVLLSADGVTPLESFREEDDGQVKSTATMQMPVYQVIVASDGPLPELPSGVYEMPIDIQKLDKWKEDPDKADRLEIEAAKLSGEVEWLRSSERTLKNELDIERMDHNALREEHGAMQKAITFMANMTSTQRIHAQKMLDMIAARDLVIQQRNEIIKNYAEYGAPAPPAAKASDLFDVSQIDDLNNSFKKRFDTAIVLHLFYEDLVDDVFSAYLDPINDIVDIFISVQQGVSQKTINNIRRRFPNSYFIAPENRGRDIKPFLLLLPIMQRMGYKYFCKIHTKKTLHQVGGAQWREALMTALLENPKSVAAIIQSLVATPTLGIIAPAFAFVNCSEPDRNVDNRVWLDRLLTALGQSAMIDKYNFFFPAGSMYWGRVEAMMPLTTGELFTLDEFEPEAGQKDGTLAHAIERIIGILPPLHGMQIGSMALKRERGMA